MGVAPEFFSCRSARSRSLLWAIIIIMMIDFGTVDLFLSRKSVIVTVVFTLLNIAGIIWFIREYIALGKGGIAIEGNSLHFSVGTVYRFDVPTDLIETAAKPGWKDIPQPGLAEARDFLLLTKQAQPNILFRLRDEREIALPFGKKKRVRRIAMHLDDPDAFMAALNPHLVPNG